MAHTSTIEKPITPVQLKQMVYQIPESWKKAAGMLRDRQRALEKHLEQVRDEWDNRTPRV